MIILKLCPVCKSEDIARFPFIGISRGFVSHKIMPGVVVDAKLVSYYSECKNCQLVFQNPRLSDSELAKYYGEGYYRRLHNLTVREMDDGEAKRAKYDAEIIKKNVSEINSHLDIGCSRGYLLDEIGAKVKVGVEPNIGYVKSKGIKVYAKMDQLPPGKFDLVTAIHVLEHVSAPHKFIESMTKLLGDDGHLVIEVPKGEYNGGSPDLAHLFQFKPNVLRRMCRQAGLVIEHEDFTPHMLLICKKDYSLSS